MNNVHGIIYAYHDFSGLGELGAHRTGASLPFCGRYRLIDFALSSMMNAGIHDVGVIMQKGYQSLMDHLGSGRTWDMSRRVNGLRLLTPFGYHGATKGVYEGCMEALDSVSTYINKIPQDYVALMRGDLCANIDLESVINAHMSSGADITAVCSRGCPSDVHHRFVPDEELYAAQLLCRQTQCGPGLGALELYVMSKKLLLEFMDWCTQRSKLHFHRDALNHFMQVGVKVKLYVHEGYARHIVSIADYYQANMDMLDAEKRAQLFPRNVTTRERSDVSTYYGDRAFVKNSLIADGCVIDGAIENCIVFGGSRIGSGSSIKNCIIMNDTIIGANAELSYVIADKEVEVSPYVTLTGNEALPIVIPKCSSL